VVVDQKRVGTLVAEVLDLMYSDWLLDRMTYNLQQVRRTESARLIADDMETLRLRHRYKPGTAETSSTLIA
jgi:hypothetical protein